MALGADALHDQGITGAGVTVAIVDTGLAPLGARGWLRQDDGSLLLAAKKQKDGFLLYRDFLTPAANDSSDPSGHGTHVAGTIANNRALKGRSKALTGVAPGVNLVVARALGPDGSGSYDQVIAAIDWIVATRATYNIRVLNLSIYAPISGPYWSDPLAQAVMRAWQAGIVVVVAAGNSGPEAASVTVPGNVPYVISVGAIKSGLFTESGSPELATFSARGPSESAFAKPDLLVPAVRVVAPMPDDSLLALSSLAGRLREKALLDLPAGSSNKEVGYYQLSGSSMAAAEVTGLVALLLQQQPALNNNQVKYRLMATAKLAQDPANGAARYSIWEQGAGMAQPAAALAATTTAEANQGMDLGIDLDPASTTHYWGLTSYDAASGSFRLPPVAGSPPGYLEWNGAVSAGSATWAGDPDVWAGAGRAWIGAGRAWIGAGRAWTGSAELWAGAGRAWIGSLPPTEASKASVELQDEYTAWLPLVIR